MAMCKYCKKLFIPTRSEYHRMGYCNKKCLDYELKFKQMVYLHEKTKYREMD